MPLPQADLLPLSQRTVIIACGALVREMRAVLGGLPDGAQQQIEVRYLPAPLHNHPERITPTIADVIAEIEPDTRIILGYADCGTGGLLDTLIDELQTQGRDIARLEGPHCYDFFSGTEQFSQMQEAELGTLYLTDYLARHFDQLIWRGFRLDQHPELIELMFASYTRVLYLAQTDDPDTFAELSTRARAAADLLGLKLEIHRTGLEPFHQSLVSLMPNSLAAPSSGGN